MKRFFVFTRKEIAMARFRAKTITGKIFDNILFLAEVFGEKSNQDIPNVPVLELTKSFELSYPRIRRDSRRVNKPWPLWK
jgi:hypothetical protein